MTHSNYIPSAAFLRKRCGFKTCVLQLCSMWALLVVHVWLLRQVSWLCSLCVCTTNCTRGLILKSPVGSFQALCHSFPSVSQVQVCPLSAVPRHSLVSRPLATLTPIQREGGREGWTDCKGRREKRWTRPACRPPPILEKSPRRSDETVFHVSHCSLTSRVTFFFRKESCYISLTLWPCEVLLAGQTAKNCNEHESNFPLNLAPGRPRRKPEENKNPLVDQKIVAVIDCIITTSCCGHVVLAINFPKVQKV